MAHINQQQNSPHNQTAQGGQSQKASEKPIIIGPSVSSGQAPAAASQKTAAKSEQSQPRRMGAPAKIIGGIIVFVVVAWVLSALRENNPNSSSLVVEEGGESNGIEVVTPNAPVSGGFASAISVVDADKTYTFDGVSFFFEPQPVDENGMASTRVRLQINGLERNGFPIEVARYRLGTYRGSCALASAGAVADFSPRALAAAQCQWDGMTRQLAVSQSGDFIVTHVRTLNEDGEQVEVPVQISSIDVTKIVQPSQ